MSAQQSETEQTPRKLSKTDSNISIKIIVGYEEYSFGSIDDTNLSVALPEEQTTVILAEPPQEENRPAQVSLQDVKGHIVVDRKIPSRCEKDLTVQEVEYYHSIYAATSLYTQDQLYSLSPQWSDYTKELVGYYSTELNEFGTYNLNVLRDKDGFHYYNDRAYFDAYEEERHVYFGPLDDEKDYTFFRVRGKGSSVTITKERTRSRSPNEKTGNKSTRMTNEVEEIEENFKDILGNTKIKPTEIAGIKMDDMGEFIKTFFGGKGTSYEDKHKLMESLTTGVPLNGKED